MLISDKETAMQTNKRLFHRVRHPLAIAGLVLIAASVVILFYIAVLVVQVLHDPAQVKLVGFLIERVESTDRAVFGNLGDQPFDIRLAEPVRYFLFLFVAVVILSILVKIFHGLIGAGITLLKLGGASSNGKASGSQSAVSSGTDAP